MTADSWPCWSGFSRRVFVATAVVFVVTNVAGMVAGGPWLQLAGFALLMVWMAIDAVVSLRLDSSKRMIRVAGWITGMIPVTIMDFTHEERQTLVRPQPDGSYIGPFSVTKGARMDTIRLLPNGIVDREHGNGHCYLWRPVDRTLEIELMLRADSWPDWGEWRRLSHEEMAARRRVLAQMVVQHCDARIAEYEAMDDEDGQGRLFD